MNSLSPEQQALLDLLDDAMQAANVLQELAEYLQTRGPVTVDDLRAGTLAHRAIIDAFIIRFARLQDLLGNKLFRTLAIIESGDPRPSTESVLDLAVSLGLVDDQPLWLRLRYLRNHFVHEYERDLTVLVPGINEALAHHGALVHAVERVASYARPWTSGH